MWWRKQVYLTKKGAALVSSTAWGVREVLPAEVLEDLQTTSVARKELPGSQRGYYHFHYYNNILDLKPQLGGLEAKNPKAPAGKIAQYGKRKSYNMKAKIKTNNDKEFDKAKTKSQQDAKIFKPKGYRIDYNPSTSTKKA